MSWRSAVSVALACLCAACGNGTTTVRPANRELLFLPPERFSMDVNLAEATVSRQPVDVLLLFDRTASMGNVIATAQANAGSIISSVKERYPNAAFGVATLADYVPNEEEWMLQQDIT